MELSSPRILLLEDDPDTIELVHEVLSDSLPEAKITRTMTLAAAKKVNLNDIDIVLSDMNLPDGKGIEFLDYALSRRPDIPVVMVTTENITSTAVKAIEIGAYDYIVKSGDYLFSIPLVVRKNLALWKTKQENSQLHSQLEDTLSTLQEKNVQLETIAATDPLTGLANRRSFDHELERHFSDASRHQRDVGLVMIDLDGFKLLNDTCGHPVGDRILERTARVLEANCRRYDLAARFGGDEFALLLPRTEMATSIEVTRRVFDEFCVMAVAESERQNFTGRLSLSAGIATRQSSSAGTAAELLDLADQSLYAAKKAGKSRIMTHGSVRAA